MQIMLNSYGRYFIKLRAFFRLWLFFVSLFALPVQAETYNLSTGSYPPCIGGDRWSVSGTTYSCGGNGRVILATGDIITSNSAATIVAANGFTLAGNTIGVATARINLTSSYGTITSSGANTIYGAVNGGSGNVTLVNTIINGTLTANGHINLTGGRVTGLVTSSNNTITTNGTNLGGGASAQSGMVITGGTLVGNFVMTSNNPITLSGVTMTSGSITGASTVSIQGGSALGSSSSSITISSTSGEIAVNGSTVYGSLTAPSYSTVNVTNGGAVYGTCAPNSTPANACNNVSTQVNHYRIFHSGTGITCAAEQITIRAYNSLGNLVNPPTGTTITLGTAPATGTWSGGNSFTFNGSTDTVIKYLRQTTATTLNINVSDGARTESAAYDPNITFYNAALQFARDSTFAPINTQIAGVANNNFILRAIRTDTNTGACVAQTTGSRSVNLAFECRNPVSCISGQNVQINGVNIRANNNNATINYQPVTLNFNASGVASIPFNYSDVGLIRLHVQLNLDGSATDPAITLYGNSGEFVVKPHTLAISTVTNLTNVLNPGTTNSGAGFVAAGEKFKVSVQSRNFSGNPTPNFGKENSPQINNVLLSASSLVYPAGAEMKPLVNGGSFSAGTPAGTFVNSDISWSQVGSIVISPTLENYLEQGAVPNYAASGTVGRFYPHRYVLANTNPINTCSINPSAVPLQQFHYMGRVFNAENVDPTTLGLQFTLNAVDASGKPVSNYDPDYKSDGNTTVNDAYGVATVDFSAFTAAQNLDVRLVNNAGAKIAPGTWVRGVMNVNQPQAQFGRLSTPDGPFTNVRVGLAVKDCLDKRLLAGANLTLDTTNSCSAPNNNAYELARFDARYGRLRLDDAFGPETANLPVNFYTEHWIGNRFVRNLNDNCTKILRSNIFYPNGNILTSSNLTVSLNGGNTTGTYGSMNSTEIIFGSGDAKHTFTAPTGGAQGKFTVNVDLTSYQWLRFDWNNTEGVPTDLECINKAPESEKSDCNLIATFGFGSYRGHDRIIYWRERF